MTLKQAANVLNNHEHRGHAQWEIEQFAPDLFAVTGPDRHEDCLSEFEAVAIAERYVSCVAAPEAR